MLLKLRFRVNSNPTLSASSSENPPITGKISNTEQTLLFRFATPENPPNESISEHEPNSVAVPPASTVHPATGAKPVPDKQLKNLEDLPEGGGNYYLGYFEGKHRRMADITVPAKKILPKLGYKKKEIKAHTDRELQSLWASCTLDEESLTCFSRATCG
jgi:hypothetical protein